MMKVAYPRSFAGRILRNEFDDSDPETFVTQAEAFLRPESRIPHRAPDP